MGSNRPKTLKCLLCNCKTQIVPPAGPASSKRKLQFKTDTLNGMSKNYCKILCKALNIPLSEFLNELRKFPVCPECCKKVHNISFIIKALERLQNTLRQFRSEIKTLLVTSHNSEVTGTFADIKPKLDDEDVDKKDVLQEKAEIFDNSNNDTKLNIVTDFNRIATNDASDSSACGIKDDMNQLRIQIINVLKNKISKVRSSEKQNTKKSTVPLDEPFEPYLDEDLELPKKRIKLEQETELLIEECKTKRLTVGLTRLDMSKFPESLSENATPKTMTFRSQKNGSVKDLGVFHGVFFVENDSDDDDNYWSVPSPPAAVHEDTYVSEEVNIPDPKNEGVTDFVPTFKLVCVDSLTDRDNKNINLTSGRKSNTDSSSTPTVSASYTIDVKKEVDQENSVDECTDGDADEFKPENSESDSWDEEDLAPPVRKTYSKKSKKYTPKKTDFLCDKCNRGFDNEFDCQVHIRKRHEGSKKPFFCTWEGCDKSYDKRVKWISHLEFHTTGQTLASKKYSCPTCGKGYDCNNSLQRHISKHTGVWKFPCTKCSKGYHRPSELEAHLKRHDNDKTIRCSYCEDTFLTKRMLIKHESLVHPDKDLKQNTRCEFCQKVFSSTDTLRCHRIQLHTGEYNFYCDVCDKGFAKESWMVRHKLQHTQEKNFPCDQCSERFRFPNSLAAHKLKHLGTFPFQCKFCDKKFILKSQLKVHEPVHSKEKPFICEYCGKAFSIEYYLNHHMKRVHFKEIGLAAPPKYYKTALKNKRDRNALKLKPKIKPKEPKKRKQKVKVSESSVHSDGDNEEVENYMNGNSMVQVELIVGELDGTEQDYLQDIETVDDGQCIQEVEIETVKDENGSYVELVVSSQNI